MAGISAKDVFELRKITGGGMMECKKALTEAEGDLDKAVEVLQKKMGKIASKKADRETKQGWIGHYVHNNGKIGVLVEVACETDFVAKNDVFQSFLRDVSMQICAMSPLALKPDELPADEVAKQRALFAEQVPQDKPEEFREKILEGKMQKWYSEVCLMQQAFVKDDKKSISDVLTEMIGKVGENMSIRRFHRMELGL